MKTIQSSRRRSRDQKGDRSMGQNSQEVTATKTRYILGVPFQTEIRERTLPKENSNEHDSDMDEDDRSLVSLLNRVPVDGDSIAPSESASCIAAPTPNPVTNRKVQPHNSSPPASQSSVCSDGFDNDSIVPITKNKRKITPEEQQKRVPSSSQTRYKQVLQARRPDKRKSESPPPSPRKKRSPWSHDEDNQLIKGFQKYKNDKLIWTQIKNKFFANSTRTNVNLKDRARTLGLK